MPEDDSKAAPSGEKKRNNIDKTLAVALFIPVFMVVAILLSALVPRFFKANPTYDFVYADSYSSDSYFDVRNGRLSVKQYPDDEDVSSPRYYYDQKAQLYYHDVSDNISRAISDEEATSFLYDDSHTSPEGFKIECGRSEGVGVFLFFDNYEDCSERYLVSGVSNYKLDLEESGSYYDFDLIGWVEK